MSTPESSIVERIAALSNPEPREAPEPQATSHEEAPNPETNATGDNPPPVAESQDTPQESPESPEVEEIEIGDLNDLANHLGVDPAELYNIAVPYTEGGQKHEFTLGELKDKYTKFAETETLRAEAQSIRDSYKQAEEQTIELIQAHAVQAASIQRAMEQQLLADFSGVNWADLQVRNPAEYIRLQQTLQARQGQLEEMKRNAIAFMEEQGNALKAQREHLQNTRLLREQEALMKAIPEWRDESVANAERQELARFMLARGYSEEEINAVDDHRALLLVRDAMKYRAQRDAGEVAKKKVIKLAKKIVKPGARQTASEQNTENERGLKQQLRRSGSTVDAAKLISVRMGRK